MDSNLRRLTCMDGLRGKHRGETAVHGGKMITLDHMAYRFVYNEGVDYNGKP